MFIADDHEGYRSGVARLVAEHPALEVVGQAADGDAALAGIVACQPDVALLDVRMPGMSGHRGLPPAAGGRHGARRARRADHRARPTRC